MKIIKEQNSYKKKHSQLLKDLKKAVSVGTLDKKAIKEIGDSFANAMFYENDFADSLVVFIDGWAIKFKEEFNKLQNVFWHKI